MGRLPVTRDYGGVDASERVAERRRRLLDAGRQLWGRAGTSAVTVRGACAGAGLTPRYFYEQFADCDMLLMAVADQVGAELLDVVLAASQAESGDVADGLRAVFSALLDRMTADPGISRICAAVLAADDSLAGRRRRALDRIETVLREQFLEMEDCSSDHSAALSREVTFIVGGLSQLIDVWLLEPRRSAADLAQICADLSLAVMGLLPR